MNKPLPQVYCSHCYRTQAYRSQGDCIHCGRRLNAWSVRSQLSAKEEVHERQKIPRFMLAPSPDSGRPTVLEKPADPAMAPVRVMSKSRRA